MKHFNSCIFFAVLIHIIGETALFSQIVYSHKLTIQPIQITTGEGTLPSYVNPAGEAGNSGLQLNHSATQAVFDKAGIQVDYVRDGNGDIKWNTYVHNQMTRVGNVQYEATFDNVANPSSRGGNTDAGIINMWFVVDLRADNTGGNLAGLTQGSRIIIDDEGVAIIDVIAHELAHSLGLDHVSTSDNNLMRPSRQFPVTVDQIVSDSHSLLTPSQISTMISSGTANGLLTAVPEPSGIALVTGIFALTWGVFQKNRQIS